MSQFTARLGMKDRAIGMQAGTTPASHHDGTTYPCRIVSHQKSVLTWRISFSLNSLSATNELLYLEIFLFPIPRSLWPLVFVFLKADHSVNCLLKFDYRYTDWLYECIGKLFTPEALNSLMGHFKTSLISIRAIPHQPRLQSLSLRVCKLPISSNVFPQQKNLRTRFITILSRLTVLLFCHLNGLMQRRNSYILYTLYNKVRVHPE